MVVTGRYFPGDSPVRQLWPLIQYYFVWQRILLLITGLGLVLFILKIAAFINGSDNLTFVLGLGAFSFLFVIPFCSGSTALRNLIANPQLAIIPGLQLKAGIAHFLIALVASLYLYINVLIFGTSPANPAIFFFYSFIFLSLYAGFMQLILPSPYFISLISFTPFIMIFIVIRFAEFLGALFIDKGFLAALFLVCVFGWSYAFYLLHKRDKFLPACKDVHNTTAWASYDGGLLINKAFGKASTAEGTLLLGYPDNWGGIILRVVYFFLLTPLMTTLAMMAIGVADKWDTSMWENVFSMFLGISLFSAVFCIFIYGELVARARLVWLRFGTDRLAQWNLVDRYCLRFLLTYYACGLLVVLAAAVFSEIPLIYLLHYFVILASFCFFNLYFSLLVRVNRLSPVILVLVIIATCAALIFSLIPVLSDEHEPRFGLLMTIELLFGVLGYLFKLSVKNIFTGIDWKLVTINKPRRQVLTQD